MSKSGTFTERNINTNRDNYNGDIHSEADICRGRTVQDFFGIEQDNQKMREEIWEVQSMFTHGDREYLEVQQEKYMAETEY